MYAIAFDLDTETLMKTYPSPSYNNVYADIRNKLNSHGFTWQHVHGRQAACIAASLSSAIFLASCRPDDNCRGNRVRREGVRKYVCACAAVWKATFCLRQDTPR